MSAPNTTRGPDAQRYALDKELGGLVQDHAGNWVQITDHWTVCIELASALARADAAEKRVRDLQALIEAADQKLSGIQYYSECKTARTEAGLVRRDLRSSFLPRTPEAS